MKNFYINFLFKKGLFILFLISTFTLSQESDFGYDLFSEGILFPENKCITESFNFSSATIKITKGDSLTVSKTSLTLFLNKNIIKFFHDYREFTNFNLKKWLLENEKVISETSIVFSYDIKLKEGNDQLFEKKYCVNYFISNGDTGQKLNYVKLPIFFATDRGYHPDADFDKQFSSKWSDLKYGFTVVSIPKSHEVGEIESPSYWKFEFREDPKKHIVIHSINVLEKEKFFFNLSKKISESSKKSTFLFIHGYNVSFLDAAKRTAQMTYDLKFDGASVFYSWPSKASTSSYTIDEETINWSEKYIENFLKDYLSKSNAEEIYLIAHSMGNRGFTNAIISVISKNPELKSKIKEIILAAPDIDARVFKRDIAPEMVSIIEKPITLYVSSKDVALKASHMVHGNARAGDSNESIVIVDGIETIDASGVDTSFMGHSYFSESQSILEDILDMIRTSRRASLRKKLEELYLNGKVFWKIKI